MKRFFIYTGIFLMIWATLPTALAQEATELFIPIGESPGTSDASTVMGTINRVDTREHLVFIQDSTGESRVIKFTDETKIYLDRSRLKETNQKGSFESCRLGLYCEVLYENRERTKEGQAAWIKIRIE